MRTMELYLAYTIAGEGAEKLYLHHMLQSLHPAEMMIPNAGVGTFSCKTQRNMPTGPQVSY